VTADVRTQRDNQLRDLTHELEVHQQWLEAIVSVATKLRDIPDTPYERRVTLLLADLLDDKYKRTVKAIDSKEARIAAVKTAITAAAMYQPSTLPVAPKPAPVFDADAAVLPKMLDDVWSQPSTRRTILTDLGVDEDYPLDMDDE
jgi:hypothetical protein